MAQTLGGERFRFHDPSMTPFLVGVWAILLRSMQRGPVVRANLNDGMSRADRAGVWRRCAGDPATLLHLIGRGMGPPGLLLVKHRAEIAHIKPAFEGSETRSRSPDGVGE